MIGRTLDHYRIISPLSGGGMGEAVPFTLMHTRGYEEADRLLLRLIALNPGNARAYGARARIVLLARGDVAAACAILRQTDALQVKVEELPGDKRLRSAIGLVYAGLGRKEDAIREGRKGVELLPYEQEALRGARRVMDLAAIYAEVGEPDLAIDQLEFLLARPTLVSAASLDVDPTWNAIRGHPRFVRLAGR
jgi:tetratricopeptide (TPR) repeat protein